MLAENPQTFSSTNRTRFLPPILLDLRMAEGELEDMLQQLELRSDVGAFIVVIDRV